MSVTAIAPADVDTVALLASIVTVGLVLLWLSGFGLVYEISIVKPAFLTNEKFWAKLAIVIVLTLNGFHIHRRILPLLRRQCGRTLVQGLPASTTTALAISGAISGVSWFFPILLGTAKEWSYVVPISNVLALYLAVLAAVSIAGTAVLTTLLPWLMRRQPRMPRITRTMFVNGQAFNSLRFD